MEKKILWAISLILVLILWIRVDSSIEENSTADSAQQNEAVADVQKAEPASKKAVTEKTLIDTKKDTKKDTKADEKVVVKDQGIKKPSTIKTVEKDTPQTNLQVNKSGVPDFAKIANIKTRKETFFNFLTPFVYEKNTLILENRQRLIDLINAETPLSSTDEEWVSALRKRSKLKVLETYASDDIAALLVYIDIIPASLVLAQAANESAWGTSRFATQGNNFFGQWCFRKGCGLVPASRNSDADHEVRKFNNVKDSVFAYINNLNSNGAYKKLRASRAALRSESQKITGLSLTHGLIHYSEKGQVYIEEIEGLINYNKLWRFNHPQTHSEIQ